jgi:heat shock protein HslJ
MRHRTTTLLLATLLAAASTLVACSSDSAVTADDLDGHTYLATSAEGQTLVPDAEVRLSFVDGFLNVHGGCNSINGAYEVADGTITWADEPFGTLIGCEAELQAQDEWLTALFADGAEASLDGEALTLTADDVTLELEQAEDVDEQAAGNVLEGTIWLLSAIDGEERPGGVEAPTLQIDTESRALVFTGCNNGSAAVTVAPDTLTFEPLVLTRVACEGETGEVEAAQTAVLDGEVAYELDGETLTLTKGDRSLTYRSG